MAALMAARFEYMRYLGIRLWLGKVGYKLFCTNIHILHAIKLTVRFNELTQHLINYEAFARSSYNSLASLALSSMLSCASWPLTLAVSM
jgi:hypothetical protein